MISSENKNSTHVDSTQTIEEYISQSDWRINANANTSYSNAGLVNNTAGKIIANFWLDQVYSPEEGHAHRNGDNNLSLSPSLPSILPKTLTGTVKMHVYCLKTRPKLAPHTFRTLWAASIYWTKMAIELKILRHISPMPCVVCAAVCSWICGSYSSEVMGYLAVPK